ncbi:hypothetical protein EIM92_18095 [Paenibacillus lentus]|uniref:Uncharacterized protein n=1 Tax=Paenibacillus lentus TaxID=1338368 RepID=A0A3S8RY31_9BACL|nr:hypothetical protein EIM92_18095 [Paenibacillus lentus]
MGEEKPDEELMGKRKSSPRLSTTFVMSIFQVCPGLWVLYLQDVKILKFTANFNLPMIVVRYRHTM